MKQIARYTRVFTLFGVTGIVVGYVVLLYTGHILNEEIENKRSEINTLEILRVEKLKQLSELESKVLEITSTSQDTNTVSLGKQLARDYGIPTGEYFKATPLKEASVDDAKEFEELGYESLLSRDVNAAIDAFTKSENSYNGYHQVYEIARFLIRSKDKLLDQDSEYWEVAYQTILSRYSWKMPMNYQSRLQELTSAVSTKGKE